MVTESRWKTAQEYERGFWQRQAESIAAGSSERLDWYEWRADQLADRLRRAGLGTLADGTARVVEVGCGPIGVCSYFPAAEALAVDPLESFYAGDRVLSELRNPKVKYLEGVGEEIPAPDAFADLLIIENCIDHVRDVDAVMTEVRRVLRPGGTLYLTVNCRSTWGYVVHRALSRFAIDAGHPHTFTVGRARRLLDQHSFQIRTFETGSFFDAWLTDLRGPALRQRLKGVLGVSEALLSLLAIRA